MTLDRLNIIDASHAIVSQMAILENINLNQSQNLKMSTLTLVDNKGFGCNCENSANTKNTNDNVNLNEKKKSKVQTLRLINLVTADICANTNVIRSRNFDKSVKNLTLEINLTIRDYG